MLLGSEIEWSIGLRLLYEFHCKHSFSPDFCQPSPGYQIKRKDPFGTLSCSDQEVLKLFKSMIISIGQVFRQSRGNRSRAGITNGVKSLQPRMRDKIKPIDRCEYLEIIILHWPKIDCSRFLDQWHQLEVQSPWNLLQTPSCKSSSVDRNRWAVSLSKVSNFERVKNNILVSFATGCYP